MMLKNCSLNKLFLNFKFVLFTVLLALCCNFNTIGQISITVSGYNNTTPNLATTYSSLASAINALNSRTAISGHVVFNLAAGGTETFATPYKGYITTLLPVSSARVTFQRSGTGANPVIIAGVGNSTTYDAIIKIVGSNYITFNGIDVAENASNINSTTQMEYGYYIINKSATDGAQNNNILNCKIILNRANTSSKAIYQFDSITPTHATGSNSNNKYQFITIENSFQGIFITGNASFPDLNLVISNCIIGSNISDDIGGAGSLNPGVNGIRVTNGSGINIFNNEIRNLIATNAINLYGIFLESLQGTTNKIYNNKIYNLKTTNNTSNAIIYGLYTEINSGAIANIYNNVIWGLQSNINSKDVKIVINALSANFNSGSTGTANFYNNAVRIDENEFPSSACLNIGNGFTTIKNNIFANFSTSGDTSLRYCINFKSATINYDVNFNDYFINITPDNTNFYIGMWGNNISNFTQWQSNYPFPDNNTFNTNPNFTSTSDLTPTAGNYLPGTTISGITLDITGNLRNDPPAMGAYEGSIAGRWLGTTSTDWDVAANWDGNAVPTPASNLYIGATTANQQHITNSAATPSECNDITIYPGAILTVDAGKALTVSGTIYNKADTTGLVLKSDATATASLIYTTNAVSATVERFIPNDNSWHFLASPVYNQNIKPQFAPITADNTFDFYKWDETDLITPGFPWLNIRNSLTTYNSGFDNFENGRGYLVAYSNAYGSTNHNFSGHLNTGSITIPITNSGNTYNLIGNPYPSGIEWDNTAMANETNYILGFNAAYWVWNGTLGNYATYNSLSGGTNNASHIIAPHQGFFVQAAHLGSIQMLDAVRIHPGSQNFLKSAVNNLVRLKISSTVNTYSDEVIVNFNSNAAADAGAAKWFSLLADAPSLYTVKNTKNFSINTLSAISNNLIVPLGFKAGVNGSYSIKASELSSFTAPAYIYLKDLKTNLIQELNQNDTYSFSGSTGDVAARFQLIFSLSPLGTENASVNNYNMYAYDNVLYINTTENIKQIWVYNMLGQLIKTLNNPGNITSFSLNTLAPDYYIVKLLSDKNVHTAKVLVK